MIKKRAFILGLSVFVAIIALWVIIKWIQTGAFQSDFTITFSPTNSEDQKSQIIEQINKNNEKLLKRIEELDQKRIEELKKRDLTFAILGTDERATETSRSDIIMIIKYYPKTNEVKLISVPRDTRVNIPGYHVDKINHAYAYGGPELSKKTLEELFGISIDYYIKINFDRFVSIIDAFGGVQVTAEKDFKEDDLIVVPQGKQVLNGEDTLFYVRFRSDSEGDYGRIRRQQEVFQSFMTNINNYDREERMAMIIQVFEEDFVTNLSFEDMGNYYKLLEYSGIPSMDCHTLKTQSKKINSIWYEILYEEDLEELKKLLQQ